MKLSYTVSQMLLVCLLLGITACSKDDDKQLSISPVAEINLEGDGTSQDVTMTSGKWNIAAVQQYGYVLKDKNGEPLQLTGTGTLKAEWCTITRNADNTLTFAGEENFAESRRVLVITLQTGIYREELSIIQGSSYSGYVIKSIVYSIEKDDAETEDNASQSGMIINNGSGSMPGWPFLPYRQEKRLQLFESADKNAFKWAYSHKGKPVLIDVPDNNAPYDKSTTQMDGTKIFYTESYYIDDCPQKDFRLEIDVPSNKKFTIHADIYRKVRLYTYVLTIVNPNTQKERVIKGKLTQRFPYDYKLTTKEEELDKEKAGVIP